MYNETFCIKTPVPELKRACETTTPCEYQWYKSQWSACSAECGKGIQNRRVVCGIFEGGSIKPTEDESKCDEDIKPEEMRECDGKTAECPGQWFSGPWTECDKECGGGVRNRKVLCLVNGVVGSECDQETILFTSEDCNMASCSPDDVLPVTVTDKSVDVTDEGEEWCDEDDEDEDDGSSSSEGVMKAIVTESIGDGVELGVSDTTDSSPLITDDVMMSDATGFETDSTDDGVTDNSSELYQTNLC